MFFSLLGNPWLLLQPGFWIAGPALGSPMLSSVPGVGDCASLSFPPSFHPEWPLVSLMLYLWDQVGSDGAMPSLPLGFLFR